jgi:basic membrane protein A
MTQRASTSVTKLPSRRHFTLVGTSLLVFPFLDGCASLTNGSSPLAVGALFAGRINDGGFMESGWRGLERARTELGVQTRHIDSVQPRRELLVAALTELAGSDVELVIAHGGQNNEACAEVATRFPGVKYAVTQGAVVGANLCSYLGGVLAALTTKTGVVGHMSGIRVRPGLKGRAAYVAGVRATNPNVKVLTNFSGNQDDNALSKRIALAQMAAGADIIFTMLNAGRDGVSEACREKSLRQIGNVVDWVKTDPEVFVASAIADVSIGVFEAVRDLQNGKFPAGSIRKVGLANPLAVRLAMAGDVPSAVRVRIAAVAADIESGKIKVPVTYEGPEFANPA